MEARPFEAKANRTGGISALLAFAGAILSGPVALAVLAATSPQPAWRGVDAFVAAYRPLQALPFFLGFFLVGGFLSLLATLHVVAREEHKARTAIALVFTAAFAALVFSNYVLQTTLVPALVADYTEGNASLLAAVTMSNPKSLGWALEMWGYGLLGVATWLAAPVFDGSRLERAAAWAFVANGPASIVSALWTAFAPGWELTAVGLVSFGVWNLLVVLMTALAFCVFRQRGLRAR
jgi:hypothetical protein